MQHLVNTPEELKEVAEKYKEGIDVALESAKTNQKLIAPVIAPKVKKLAAKTFNRNSIP